MGVLLLLSAHVPSFRPPLDVCFVLRCLLFFIRYLQPSRRQCFILRHFLAAWLMVLQKGFRCSHRASVHPRQSGNFGVTYAVGFRRTCRTAGVLAARFAFRRSHLSFASSVCAGVLVSVRIFSPLNVTLSKMMSLGKSSPCVTQAPLNFSPLFPS